MLYGHRAKQTRQRHTSTLCVAASRERAHRLHGKIGAELFAKIRYTQLVKIADGYQWKKKTYNNVISALRCAFEYGYRDHPEKHNPASGLKCFRITKKDRPAVDPFSIHEAESLIRAIHLDWGEAQGNYDEFRVFTDVEAIRRAMESRSPVPGRTRVLANEAEVTTKIAAEVE